MVEGRLDVVRENARRHGPLRHRYREKRDRSQAPALCLLGVYHPRRYTIKGFNLFACSITTDKDARTNRSIVEAARDITLDGLNVKYPSHQTEMTGNWQDRHSTWTGLVVSGRNNTIRNCVIRSVLRWP